MKVVRVVAPLINRLAAEIVVSRPVSRHMSTIIGDKDRSIILVESASMDGDVGSIDEIMSSGHRVRQ